MALYSLLKPHLHYFLSQLENYNEAPFNREIKKYGFSVGFVFKELCEEFNVRVIPGIEECVNGGNPKSKGKTFKGFFTMLFNNGSRSDNRTLAEEYSTHNNFTISMIRDELYRIMKRMEALDADISSMKKGDVSANRSLHEKLGYLNAKEWYSLAINNSKQFKSIKESLDKELSK